MEIEGPTTIADWRMALDQIQHSQPLFSACIEPNAGGRPYFRHMDAVSIPMRILDGSLVQSWESEMATEVVTPFDANRAPLLRTVLLYLPQRSIFIIAAHHPDRLN
jgi:hypothetical protein